jgi:hypothetical protein
MQKVFRVVTLLPSFGGAFSGCCNSLQLPELELLILPPPNYHHYTHSHSIDSTIMASGVDAKLLKSTKFPPEYSKKVDMQKVNLEVMKQYVFLCLFRMLPTIVNGSA